MIMTKKMEFIHTALIVMLMSSVAWYGAMLYATWAETFSEMLLWTFLLLLIGVLFAVMFLEKEAKGETMTRITIDTKKLMGCTKEQLLEDYQTIERLGKYLGAAFNLYDGLNCPHLAAKVDVCRTHMEDVLDGIWFALNLCLSQMCEPGEISEIERK